MGGGSGAYSVHVYPRDGLDGNMCIQCCGEATTVQLPEGLLTSDSNGSPSKLAGDPPRGVSIPPSRRPNIRCPTLTPTASPCESIEWYSISEASSGVPGPGYLSGKALKWLGLKSLSALDVSITFVLKYQHMAHRKIGERFKGTKFGNEKYVTLFRILEDARELSR
jgi:hypothetical protein